MADDASGLFKAAHTYKTSATTGLLHNARGSWGFTYDHNPV